MKKITRLTKEESVTIMILMWIQP